MPANNIVITAGDITLEAELNDSETAKLRDCEQRLGYRFRDLRYLFQALTHSSIKTHENPSNERLEFLGDAVLGVLISGMIFDSFPSKTEGS